MDFPADITLRKTRMKFWIERSRLFCYSVIKVLCVLFLWHNFFIISYSEVLVKNFFNFVLPFSFFSGNSSYILSFYVKNIKYFFVINNHNGEEGIWTLAPLLTTYSLSRRAPSASWVLLQTVSKNSFKEDVQTNDFLLDRWYGEGGIRTHGTFQYHWFSRPAP